MTERVDMRMTVAMRRHPEEIEPEPDLASIRRDLECVAALDAHVGRNAGLAQARQRFRNPFGSLPRNAAS